MLGLVNPCHTIASMSEGTTESASGQKARNENRGWGFKNRRTGKSNARSPAAGRSAKKYCRLVTARPIKRAPKTAHGSAEELSVFLDVALTHAIAPSRANSSAGPSVRTVAMAVREWGNVSAASRPKHQRSPHPLFRTATTD